MPPNPQFAGKIMKPSHNPFVTTLVGGVLFLLPLVVLITVFGQGVALVARMAAPLTARLPEGPLGGIGLATIAAAVLLLLLCYGAGLAARATLARSLSERFEAQLLTVYPRYAVIKAMSQGLRGALGQRGLKPVMVTFDDHQLIAFEMERLDDGRAVLYLPGAPDAWSGSVLLASVERIEPLDIDSAQLARSMQRLGMGTAALLQGAAAGARPETGP
jgi:uncharacterized membrane protein